MQHRSSSCWQCGTAVSSRGARCSACGAEQPPLSDDPASTGDPSPSAPLSDAGSSGAPAWIALAIGLALLGVGAALLRPRVAVSDPGPARSAPPAVSETVPAEPPPNDLGPFDPKAADPIALLGKAKARALAWSKDALLVSIRADPVVAGRVDLEKGGTIEYTFGKPTGESLSPGTKVSGKRLRVALTRTGGEIDEVAGPPARAALEPNCLLDAAAHAAVSAGLPPDTPLLAVYDLTEKLAQKPVWHISSSGNASAQRLIDGMSCAVLVPR